ncbi:S-layer homology domain-containing protein [Paenibacillus allorhizosphaerae]|uniref:SLH domain-containing protein n=1 Tax=Paenibacillus allorhizosphaerae TaxID=2849866 RepID=A0ABN7TUG0_9BACL|nr:S-layer homology domain-containing protein [Paenibacillus allorhizosphaerae]CAG7652425.1 hypothetical protein PAECIP111802_05210 [Paenibacillus allorhizosphaerae]
MRYKQWKRQGSCLSVWIIVAMLLAPLFTCLEQSYAEGLAEPQSSVTSRVYDQVTGAVYFPDTRLESAIRETLGIPERYVTSEDLSRMTELVAKDKGISNLSGIEYAVNLQKLVLPHNQINDISALKGLSQLNELILFGNQIEHIASLSQVTSLEKLYLNNNRITDIEAFRNLTNLTELGLSHNQIRDISALVSLQKLKLLELDHNEIANMSQLAGLLPHMETMTLYDNPAQEMAPFLLQLEKHGVKLSETVMLAGFVKSDVTNVNESAVQLNEFTASYGAHRQSSPYGLYTVADGYERNAFRYLFQVPKGSYTIAAWNAGLSDSVTTDTYVDSAVQLLYDYGALFQVKSLRDLSLQEQPSDSGDSDSSSDGGDSTSAGELVQAALGGTVSVEGASVTIPRLAFPDNVLVKIEAYSNGYSISLNDRSVLASQVFNMSKHIAGNFTKPVTVTLAYDKSGVDLSKQELVLAWLDESTDTWIPLDNLAVDLQKVEISGTITHLGKFAVLAVEKKLDDQPSQPSQPQPPAYPKLSDIRGHWAEAQIKRFVERGALDGYPDGTFKPDAGITRAEFVTFLVKELGIGPGGESGFADAAQHWAKSYIAAAAQAGIVSGYSSASFGPDDPITREQIVLMLANANVLKSINAGQAPMFADTGDISPWAKEAVYTAVSEGIMDGYSDGTLKPQGLTTRAEAVTFVSRVLKK